MPRDFSWRAPDALTSVPSEERHLRVKLSSDLCQIDERYFVRCVLPIPLIFESNEFGWGLWVETEWNDFERYWKSDDRISESVVKGTLANCPPVYKRDMEEVELQFSEPILNQRPRAICLPNSRTELALEQRSGMSAERHHEVLAALDKILDRLT
jgi:hypothetical protein